MTTSMYIQRATEPHKVYLGPPVSSVPLSPGYTWYIGFSPMSEREPTPNTMSLGCNTRLKPLSVWYVLQCQVGRNEYPRSTSPQATAPVFALFSAAPASIKHENEPATASGSAQYVTHGSFMLRVLCSCCRCTRYSCTTLLLLSPNHPIPSIYFTLQSRRVWARLDRPPSKNKICVLRQPPRCGAQCFPRQH